MFPNNDVTCVSPWYSLRIDTDGTYKFCDFATDFEKSTLLPSQWFAGGRLIVESRQNIQQGRQTPGCARCYHKTDTQIDSYRQRKNLQAAIHHGPYFQESLAQSPAQLRIQSSFLDQKKPGFIHVSLSNLCNLACRMCSAKFSSKVAAVHKKMNVVSADAPTLVDWTSNNEMWEDFSQNLVLNNAELVCLHFMGGEPLYHEKFFQLIKDCVDQDKTDFHLTFVTNGTSWPEKLTWMLSKFRSVTIEISLENLHITNNYVRHGSDYQLIQSNLLELLSIKTDTISIVLRPVPQALSIEHYDSLIDFAIQHKLHIDANVLVTPRELSIVVLPKSIKKLIINKFKTKYAHMLGVDAQLDVRNIRNQEKLQSQISYHIQRIIDFLSEPEPDDIEDLRCKFVRYNQNFDRATATKFEQYYPDLLDFYEKYYNC